MPIYEYVCSDCNSKFELMRPFSRSSEDAACPKCKNSAKRVLSTFASVSKDSSGMSTPIGGSSCSCGSCGGGSCSTCSAG